MWDKIWVGVGIFIIFGFLLLSTVAFISQDSFPSEADKVFKEGDVVTFMDDNTKLYNVYSVGTDYITIVEIGKPAYINRSFNGQRLNYKYFKKVEPKNE